jgi:hypothetical protein
VTTVADRMIALDPDAVRALTILALMDRQAELKRRIDAAIESLSPDESSILIELMRRRRRDGGGGNG